nr:LysE family translocator [Gammaproteobacteria bacterium]
LYVVTRSATQGRRAGLVSAMGLSAGALVHVLAASAGLSALLLTSAIAFSAVKMLGAAYLVYLGLKALFGQAQLVTEGNPTPRALSRLFTDGIIVSVLNPKIAVFLLAFLPQFVDPENGAVASQVLLLGLLYVALALITDSGYALLASGVRHRLSATVVDSPIPRYLGGTVFIGLGIGTALSDPITE